jgi:hypothetical protein
MKKIFLLLLLLSGFIASQSQNPSSLLLKTAKQIQMQQWTQARKGITKLKESGRKSEVFLAAALLLNEEGKHPDSAFLKLMAAKPWPQGASSFKNKQLLIAGIHPTQLRKLSLQLEQSCFVRAIQQDSIEGWQAFIDVFQTTELCKKAIGLRNDLAFEAARKMGSSDAISRFLGKYPDAEQAEKALELYDDFIYQESTADGQWTSYLKFLENNPKSRKRQEATDSLDVLSWKALSASGRADLLGRYLDINPLGRFRQQALNEIFILYANAGHPDSCKAMIRTFPAHPRLGEIWELLYRLEVKCEDSSTISAFWAQYPQYPDSLFLMQNIHLAAENWSIYQEGEGYGFIKNGTDTVSGAIYSEANPFSCGWALVAENCDSGCYYFINKRLQKFNKEPFALAYPFENAQAVVATGRTEDGEPKAFGLLESSGKFLIKADYDYMEPGGLSGVYIAGKAGIGLGYLLETGEWLSDSSFADAMPFSEGLGLVRKDSSWFYLHPNGKAAWNKRYAEADPFSDSLAVVSEDGIHFGYIRTGGQWAIQPKFDYASDFQNGLAVVGTKSKNRKTGQMSIQRFEIDKSGKQIRMLKAETQGKSRKRRGRR